MSNLYNVYNVFIGDIQFCAKHEININGKLNLSYIYMIHLVGNQNIMHFLIVQNIVSYYGWTIGYSIEF